MEDSHEQSGQEKGRRAYWAEGQTHNRVSRLGFSQRLVPLLVPGQFLPRAQRPGCIPDWICPGLPPSLCQRHLPVHSTFTSCQPRCPRPVPCLLHPHLASLLSAQPGSSSTIIQLPPGLTPPGHTPDLEKEELVSEWGVQL